MIETQCGALAHFVAGRGSKAAAATSQFIEEHGLAVSAAWFPLHQVLAILRRVGNELGDDVLYEIGASVPDHCVFPTSVDGIGKALQSLDVTYHMNHRKNGTPMFDPGSGQFAEGIGCFVCTDDTSGSYIVDSASLYPCAFDRGVITTIARRFEPHAEVQHLDGARCRKHGSLTCAYVITW